MLPGVVHCCLLLLVGVRCRLLAGGCWSVVFVVVWRCVDAVCGRCALLVVIVRCHMLLFVVVRCGLLLIVIGC